MRFILQDQDRRSEGCPLCVEIKNKKEGDLFEACDKHYRIIMDKEKQNWIDVHDLLPHKNEEVQVIASGYFGRKSSLYLSLERRVFNAIFNPAFGWKIFHYDGPVAVVFWKPIDDETSKILLECDDDKQLFYNQN